MAKGGSPKVPNYSQLARQDYQQGLQTANFNAGLNRINQYGPTGSVTYQRTPRFNQSAFDQAMAAWQKQYAPIGYGGSGGGNSGYYPPGYGGDAGPGGATGPGTGSGGIGAPGSVDGTGAGTGIGGASPPGSAEGSADGYSVTGKKNAQGIIADTPPPAASTPPASSGQPIYSNPISNPGGSNNPAMPTQADFTTDDWAQYTTLSPEQQKLYDSNVATQQGMADLTGGALGRVGSTLNSALPNSNVAVSSVNGGQGYESSRDAVVRAMMQRAQPGIDANRHDLESSLLNSGIEKGTDAWNREKDRQGRQENDMYTSALLAGGQEQSRLAGLDLNAAQFANSAAGQQFMQGLAARGIPMQELQQLIGGVNPATNPQLPQYYTTSGGSAGGSQMEAAQNSYSASMARNNADNASTNSTYGAILSALAMFSDERLKDNIQTIGMHPAGVRRVRWDWKDGSGSDWGVIAQELQEVVPAAVITCPKTGFLKVDYNLIGGR